MPRHLRLPSASALGVGVVLVLLGAACAASRGDHRSRVPIDSDSVGAALVQKHLRGAEALRQGDLQRILEPYAPTAIGYPADWPLLRGKESIKQFYRQMLAAADIKDLRVSPSSVEVSGDLAVETGTFTLTLQPKSPGAPAVTTYRKYLIVWKRQEDGSWKIQHEISNANPPPSTE